MFATPTAMPVMPPPAAASPKLSSAGVVTDRRLGLEYALWRRYSLDGKDRCGGGGGGGVGGAGESVGSGSGGGGEDAACW